MAKLTVVTCETVKSDPIRDRLLGDGDGLFLRVRPHGTKTWVIEYEFQGKRTKYTIGAYSRQSAPGESISDWLRHGQQSLSQARSIAGCWKAAWRSGHDPAAEWDQNGHTLYISHRKQSRSLMPSSPQALKPITGSNRHVFASPIKQGQAIYGRSVNNALATLFSRGKLPNVTCCHVHDFRRTLITRLPDLGFEPFLGHKIANHVLSGVFAHYNHNSYEQQREVALKTWVIRLETLATESNVIQLHLAV